MFQKGIFLVTNMKLNNHKTIPKIKGGRKMSNMRKLGTFLAMVALAILALIVIMPDAYAADLTGPGPNDLPTDTPDPAAAGLTAMHTIDFTTATAGTIKYVDITFPMALLFPALVLEQ